jgi:aconitase B
MKQPRTLSYFFSLGDFRVNVRCVVFEEELEIEEVLDSNDVDVFNYLNEEALEDLQALAEAEAKYDGWLPDPDAVTSDDDIALWNHPDGGL